MISRGAVGFGSELSNIKVSCAGEVAQRGSGAPSFSYPVRVQPGQDIVDEEEAMVVVRFRVCSPTT